MTSAEILNRVKRILENKNPDAKITDQFIASALGVSQGAVQKSRKRGTLSRSVLEGVNQFCAKEKIAINDLLYSQKPYSLQDLSVAGRV